MASKASDLTPAAKEGYEAPEGAKAPYMATSPNEMAYRVGQWLKGTGRTEPRGVRMSRGYTMHANDMLLSIEPCGAVNRVR